MLTIISLQLLQKDPQQLRCLRFLPTMICIFITVAKHSLPLLKKQEQAQNLKPGTYAKGTFYVKVVGVNGAFNSTNCYTLNITPGTATLNTESISASAIADNSLRLYPNPVTSVLNIKTSKLNSGTTIKIADIFGKTVLSQQLNSSESQIDVSKLAGGTYLLIVINKEGIVINTSKFVKQ